MPTLDKQQAIFEEKLAIGFPVIIATIDDRAVGFFGYCSEFRFREAYKFTVEHSVYLMPNEHGKGAVKTILKNLIELLKSKNCIL
ncbi:MAG: GNAT family N-acetyltransferase [Flavobacterium sp.]